MNEKFYSSKSMEMVYLLSFCIYIFICILVLYEICTITQMKEIKRNYKMEQLETRHKKVDGHDCIETTWTQNSSKSLQMVYLQSHAGQHVFEDNF